MNLGIYRIYNIFHRVHINIICNCNLLFAFAIRKTILKISHLMNKIPISNMYVNLIYISFYFRDIKFHFLFFLRIISSIKVERWLRKTLILWVKFKIKSCGIYIRVKFIELVLFSFEEKIVPFIKIMLSILINFI